MPTVLQPLIPYISQKALYQQCIAKSLFAKTSATPWGFPYTHTMQKAAQCHEACIFYSCFCFLSSDWRLHFGNLMGVKWEWICWQWLIITAKLEFWTERTTEKTTHPKSQITLKTSTLPCLRQNSHWFSPSFTRERRKCMHRALTCWAGVTFRSNAVTLRVTHLLVSTLPCILWVLQHRSSSRKHCKALSLPQAQGRTIPDTEHTTPITR